MQKLTLEAIREALSKKGLEAELQKESNQLHAKLEIEKCEYPLFVRIYEDSDLIQMLAFFPFEVKTKAIPDVARLLHLFNRELDIPGFGMDENAKVAFFRCMIPSKERKLDTTLLEAYLNTITMACQAFHKPIEAVAAEVMTFEELLTKARKMEK